MGYGKAQLHELEATIRATPCDVVIVGTPIDLRRVLDPGHPLRRVTYELQEVGTPTLATILEPHILAWQQAAREDQDTGSA
jgi:predicted GTPase